jgi:Leucine-rich repeat (LRR) protein
MDSRTLDASNIRRNKGGNAKDSISPPSHQIDPSQTKSINTIKNPRQESRTDYSENLKEFLDLSNKRLSLSDISPIIKSHRYVKKLDLSSCGLTTLPEGLEYCDELEELNLSNNHLSHLRSPCWCYIPWVTLRKLNLSGCGLGKLPEGLKFCDELEELNLSNNDLSNLRSPRNWCYIPWRTLRKLDLSGCGLTRLPESLKFCDELGELNLSNNPLSHLRAPFCGLRLPYSAIFLPVPQARIFGEVLKVFHSAQNWPVCVRCPLTIRARTSGRHFAKFHQRAYIPWGTLRKLDLSGCRLRKLPGCLKFCDELEELNLSNNLQLNLLEELNSGHSSDKTLFQSKTSGLVLSKPTCRIIFEDAIYTQSSGG